MILPVKGVNLMLSLQRLTYRCSRCISCFSAVSYHILYGIVAVRYTNLGIFFGFAHEHKNMHQ